MNIFITLVGYILGLVIILCISLIYDTPVKHIIKLILNSFIGCIILSFANLVLYRFGYHAGISPFSAVFTGVLGIPGALGIIVLSLII